MGEEERRRIIQQRAWLGSYYLLYMVCVFSSEKSSSLCLTCHVGIIQLLHLFQYSPSQTRTMSPCSKIPMTLKFGNRVKTGRAREEILVHKLLP